MALHRTGELARAVAMYEAVVQKTPRQVAALNLLALAYFQSGQAERAVPPMRRALKLDPALPSGHYNLARIFQALNRYDEARQSYQRALTQQPNDAEIRNNLGTVLRALGRNEEAADQLRKAVGLQPGYAAAHFNLGNACLQMQKNEEACAAFERALRLKPGLAGAHLHWGRALLALGRNEDALARLDEAILIHPGDREAHFHRGNALDGLRRHEEAFAGYEKALAPSPDGVDAHILNGNALVKLKRFEEAITSYRQVLVAKPDHADAHYNLGIALQELERTDEALQSFVRALKIAPADPRYLWNRCLLDLSLGKFSAGWSSFDHRWRAVSIDKPSFSQPRWDGRYVDGALLVWGEQGLGDQILYSSIVEDLRRCAKSVRLEVEPRLVRLLARSMHGVDVQPLGVGRDLAAIAAQESLSDIGRYLRPTWESFGQPQNGYLVADAARTEELRARLKTDGKHVIGLSWQSRKATQAQAKTANLSDFETVLRIPDCRFVDLQYGDTQAEREELARTFGVEVERLPDVDNFNDIDGLAALISACDLVVTVSNTTAHIAGALGQRTWVMVPTGNARFWYWFRKKNVSPWYARVSVKFRDVGQPWPELVNELAPEVIEALKRR